MKHDDTLPDKTVPLKPALVLGGGIAGLIAARALLAVQIPVTLVSVSPPSDDLICAGPGFDTDEFVRGLRGSAKDARFIHMETWPLVRRDGHQFRAWLGEKEEGLFGCVFVASPISMTPPNRLLPQATEVVSVKGLSGPPGRIGFLLDYSKVSSPAAGMLALKQALDNASGGGQSFVLFKHAPVVHVFGETLYEQARNAGVRFHRFGSEVPFVEEVQDTTGDRKCFRVTVRDVVESGEPVTFECERIVTATRLDASSAIPSALAVSDGDLDADGFLLGESIHCASGEFFSSGVFAVGGATGNTDLLQTLAQASAAAVQARAWLLHGEQQQDSRTVTIGTECCRCLTCARVCPHAAISLHSETAHSAISVSAPLCRECGVCVSECPRLVLDLDSMPEADLGTFLEGLRVRRNEKPMVLYGCQRSGGKLAQSVELPASVVPFQVPCAGRVSEAIIWATLASGAGGVLVVGCHHGNCRSDTGTDWAGSHVMSLLEALGLSPGVDAPVRYATVAPNEPARFGRLVKEFAAAARTLHSLNWSGKTG